MTKIIEGKELNTQLDRLATETRQLLRGIKALRDASTETDSERDAFFTLLGAKLHADSDMDEKEIFVALTKSPARTSAAAAAAETLTADKDEIDETTVEPE
jgi:hypothetical protein